MVLLQPNQGSKRAEWKHFDGDVDQILEATAKGNVDHRLRTMTTLIASIADEPFGPEAPGTCGIRDHAIGMWSETLSKEDPPPREALEDSRRG